MEPRSVDLIDICPGLPVQDAMVTLFDGEGDMRTYFVPGGWTRDVAVHGPPGYGTLDLTTLANQIGVGTEHRMSAARGACGRCS